MSIRSGITRSSLIGLAAWTFTACGGDGGTAPDAAFDPVRVRADVDAVMSSFQAAPLESFSALSARFGLEAAPGELAASARDLLALRDARDGSPASQPGRVAANVANDLLALSPQAVAGVPVFGQEKLGTTLVYDATLRRYVASSRAGAPANGVRFILYAVNPVTREPLVETEIGHADLLDEGRARPSGIGLRLVIVSGTVTYLDYAVVIDGTPTTGRLAVDGMLTDGVTRANFEIDAEGSAAEDGGTLAVDFEFDVPSRAFRLTAKVRGEASPTTHTEEIELVVRSQGTTIRYDVAGDRDTIDATIYVNGRIFATATGDRSHPDVRGAGGRALTEEEVQALRGILHLADGAFLLFANLLRPVGVILLLSTMP